MEARKVEASPYKVLMPQGLAGPIEVVSEYSIVRMAVVERAHATRLDRSWNVPGAYLLLDRPDALGRWGAYVGMAAPGTLAHRLRDHLRARDHWYRAVLIRRDNEHPFHTSQAGWLEGHLYDLLAQAPHVRLHNGKRPQDLTLSSHDQTGMRTCVPPIIDLLHFLSHALDPAIVTPPQAMAIEHAEPPAELASPASARPTETSASRRPRYRSSIKVLDLIEAGLLAPGTRLVPKPSHLHEQAVVNMDGTLQFRGTPRDKPSDPASELAGSQQNGWEFWRIETRHGLTSLADLRKELERRQAAARDSWGQAAGIQPRIT
ncbi:hypothetical protein GBF35_45945 [Nonomuraea phyllanthi]|uniref:restriction system modified-DNA reader domain-containing protein n=1 Tax=Nonomuraea phyllanthi TaxID=2219224 RepID=UPI001293AA76|nr:hypothetical protein [Nonomuraea phyllanthi]QFY12932.1 hypothetical protein GBF35_45945 [Nonomuraea phyllanthi]